MSSVAKLQNVSAALLHILINPAASVIKILYGHITHGDKARHPDSCNMQIFHATVHAQRSNYIAHVNTHTHHYTALQQNEN